MPKAFVFLDCLLIVRGCYGGGINTLFVEQPLRVPVVSRIKPGHLASYSHEAERGVMPVRSIRHQLEADHVPEQAMAFNKSLRIIVGAGSARWPKNQGVRGQAYIAAIHAGLGGDYGPMTHWVGKACG